MFPIGCDLSDHLWSVATPPIVSPINRSLSPQSLVSRNTQQSLRHCSDVVKHIGHCQYTHPLMADQWGSLPQVRFRIGTLFFYFITRLIVYSHALAGKHLRIFSLVFPCKVCKYCSCICCRINFGFPLQESRDFALIVRLPLQCQ
jgi:hypothetical protein